MMMGLVGLVIGIVGGAIGALMVAARSASFRRTLPEKTKPIIHMRGHQPAWFKEDYCEEDGCWREAVEGRPFHYYKRNACYVDQDGHYWCERHLPKDTKVAERASINKTEDGRCVTHDYKCPKPWEPY